MVADSFGKCRPRRIEILEYQSAVEHKINPIARLQHTRAQKLENPTVIIFQV